MPVWGESSKKILDLARCQTPKNKGIWKDMIATTDYDKADFYIVQDYTEIPIEFPERTIFFRREIPGAGRIDDFSNDDRIKKFDYIEGTSYFFTKWLYWNSKIGGIGKTYDDLKDFKNPKKDVYASTIQSNKTQIEGQRKRLLYLYEIKKKNPDIISFYGTMNKLLQFNDAKPLENKFDLLSKSKYYFAFDNNDYDYYFGAQLTDAFLCWCFPIYWKSKILSKFFPENSFYLIDDLDDLSSINKIFEFLDKHSYEDVISSIQESRDLILDKYNMWPTIYRAITEGKVI
jgi:hypothetical protein